MSSTIELSPTSAVEVDGDITERGRIVTAYMHDGSFEIQETHNLHEKQSNVLALLAVGATRVRAAEILGKSYETTTHHVGMALRNLGGVGLNAAITQLFEGRQYETTREATNVDLEALNKSEYEVLLALSDGLSIKDIMQLRQVGEATVRTQIKTMQAKLKPGTVAGAVTLLRMNQQYEAAALGGKVGMHGPGRHTYEVDDETSVAYYGKSLELGRVTSLSFGDGVIDVDPHSKLSRKLSRVIGLVAIGQAEPEASAMLNIPVTRYRNMVNNLRDITNSSTSAGMLDTAFKEGYLEVSQEADRLPELSRAESRFLRLLADGETVGQISERIQRVGGNSLRIKRGVYAELGVSTPTAAVTTGHVTGLL